MLANLTPSRLSQDEPLDPVGTMRYLLGRIETYDPTLNCFIALDAEGALKEAAESERRLRSGQSRGPLEGIPVALKDLIDVKGWPTTAGLREPWEACAEEDAFLVSRLREAGAIVLGKLNLHEAAMGATTDNPHYGKTRNPWNPDCTPGGSSGGSGAAVAAMIVPAALGSDTMGSVRIPAAYCGISGLKPTFGRVSLRGVTPLCWSLDTVGPLARDVNDIALLMDALDGFDSGFPHARPAPDEGKLYPIADRNPKEFTLGVIEGWGDGETETAVGEAFRQALKVLQNAGCSVRTFQVEQLELARRHGLIIIEGDAALIHARRLAEHPGQLGSDVRAQLEYGSRMPAGKLAQALEYRELLRSRFRRILSEVDAVISPTAPQAAFPFGGEVPPNQALFTAPASLCGLPALSVPMGFNEQGLPLGLQLTGAPWREDRLLELGKIYQGLSTKLGEAPLSDWTRYIPGGYE
ncbi:MAG: amidase [bacterium]